MWKNVKLQFLLVAGLSALLGYAAAYGKLNPFQKADAGPAEQPNAAAADDGCRAGLLLGRTVQGGHGRPGGPQRSRRQEGRRGRQEAEHPLHHGRRHRHVEHRRLPSRPDGRPDAEPRQAGQGRHAVHRLLRRGELHGGPGELHHRRIAHPHRHDHGRPGGRQDRHTGGSLHDCHRAQGAGLRHRPVRQEPSGRPQRVPAHRPRLRRILRLPVSPGRDGRPGASRTIRRTC